MAEKIEVEEDKFQEELDNLEKLTDEPTDEEVSNFIIEEMDIGE